MNSFLFFAVSSIILLLLCETLDIEFVFDKKISLIITYSVFEITLSGFGKNKEKAKKRLKRRLRSLPSLKAGFDYILSRSKIEVFHSQSRKTGTSFFRTAVASYGVYSVVLSLLFSYTEANAKSLTYTEIPPASPATLGNGDAYIIKISQKTQLIYLIIALLISALSKIKKLKKAVS